MNINLLQVFDKIKYSLQLTSKSNINIKRNYLDKSIQIANNQKLASTYTTPTHNILGMVVDHSSPRENQKEKQWKVEKKSMERKKIKLLGQTPKNKLLG